VVQTGTVCITNCATQQVQSALQTVLQNRYSLHYKLCYRTGTVCITNCTTQQVQTALPAVQHSGHIVRNDVVYHVPRVDVLVAQVQEVLPLASQHLQTKTHIATVSVRRCGRPETGFRISCSVFKLTPSANRPYQSCGTPSWCPEITWTPAFIYCAR